MSSLTDSRAAEIRQGCPATVDGSPTTADLTGIHSNPPTLRLLPSISVAPGSVINVDAGISSKSQFLAVVVTPHLGYRAVEVLRISTTFVAYDTAGNTVCSGPCAYRTFPPGVVVPANVAPPVGSLFATGGGASALQSVADVNITGGIATLSLTAAPPEYL